MRHLLRYFFLNFALVFLVITPLWAQESDLQVVKESDLTSVEELHPLIYTVTVTNNGPDNNFNVSMTDTLPNVTFNSVSSTQGTCVQASGVVSCALGDLALGGVVTITITVTAPNVANQDIDNTATVTGAIDDPDPDNNTSSVTTSVVPIGGGCHLSSKIRVNAWAWAWMAALLLGLAHKRFKGVNNLVG